MALVRGDGSLTTPISDDEEDDDDDDDHHDDDHNDDPQISVGEAVHHLIAKKIK